MPKVREAAVIMVGADALWNEVGDFRSLAQGQPPATAMPPSAATGTEAAGKDVRVIRFEDGREQLERLEASDAAHHVYRYKVERTSMPVRDYTGEFRIEKVDTQMSRVIWESQFTLADEDDGHTTDVIRALQHQTLTEIEEKYRPYANLEPGGVDREIADADKQARTGKSVEPVRNTPPAGAWNDTSSD